VAASPVFIDTSYLVAGLMKRDALHDRARRVKAILTQRSFITTEGVLAEVLAYISGFGSEARAAGVALVRDMQRDTGTSIMRHTTEQFEAGIDLYAARADKSYSLVDCISMVVCRAHDVSDVLTADRHFEQEGFTALLRGG
jgi:predicted nucleic acid-binding protein